MLQANDRCRAVSSVQTTHVSRCRCFSTSTRHHRSGEALEQGRRHALGIWQAYLSDVIDFCAAHVVAVNSQNALSRVTRSRTESLPVWSSSGYGSRTPRPRTRCAGEYALSSLAELQARVTAAVRHRNEFDAQLVDQLSRACFPDSSMPLGRLRVAVE